MEEKLRKAWNCMKYVMLMAFAFGILLLFVRLCAYGKKDFIEGHDTIWVDTTYVHKVDTMYEVVKKKLTVPELAFVTRIKTVQVQKDTVLEYEQKHYHDSTYSVWVSGIDVKLDSADMYFKNKVIHDEKTVFCDRVIESTVTKKEKPKWNLSISTGYDVMHGNVGIFVSVGRSIITW